MAARKAPQLGSKKVNDVQQPKSFSRIFSSARMIIYFVLWLVYFLINAALLGLVSEQIHKYGGTTGAYREPGTNYPNAQYGHAMGLLLFTAIIGVLASVFHWALGLGAQMFIFFILAVFNGTGAGIFEKTEFGHGGKCSNPASSFPAEYRPYLGECTRVTAIESLAWALFALGFIGLVFTFFDKFNLTSRRSQIYDLEVPLSPEEKAALSKQTSEAH